MSIRNFPRIPKIILRTPADQAKEPCEKSYVFFSLIAILPVYTGWTSEILCTARHTIYRQILSSENHRRIESNQADSMEDWSLGERSTTRDLLLKQQRTRSTPTPGDWMECSSTVVSTVDCGVGRRVFVHNSGPPPTIHFIRDKV